MTTVFIKLHPWEQQQAFNTVYFALSVAAQAGNDRLSLLWLDTAWLDQKRKEKVNIHFFLKENPEINIKFYRLQSVIVLF